MVGAGAGLFVIDVLLFFFSIGGLLVLSLLDDERFVGSVFSISCTFRLIYWASGQCLATLCNNAVVDDVLNRPNARRRNPWLKHASTAAHNDVTEPDSSWTNFRVTASSIICFTSFLTAAISRSLKSMASVRKEKRRRRRKKSDEKIENKETGKMRWWWNCIFVRNVSNRKWIIYLLMGRTPGVTHTLTHALAHLCFLCVRCSSNRYQ